VAGDHPRRCAEVGDGTEQVMVRLVWNVRGLSVGLCVLLAPACSKSTPQGSLPAPKSPVGAVAPAQEGNKSGSGVSVVVSWYGADGEWVTYQMRPVGTTTVKIERTCGGAVEDTIERALPAGSTLLELAQAACHEVESLKPAVEAAASSDYHKLVVTISSETVHETAITEGSKRELFQRYATPGPLYTLLSLVSKDQPKGYRFVHESGPLTDTIEQPSSRRMGR
jgi:hypothetical protein